MSKSELVFYGKNMTSQNPMQTAEQQGRERYQLAVESLELTAIEKFFRPLQRFWCVVGTALGDFRELGLRIRSNVEGFGLLLQNEVSGLLQEIQDLPGTTRQMWRDGDFLRPFQGVLPLLQTIRIARKDFICNWQYSAQRGVRAFHSPWSMRCKLYIGGVILLSAYTIYHKKIRPWPRHDTKTELSCLYKTVVITGASSGLGYRLAFEFAQRGAFVILTSPDMVKARKARVDLSRKLERHIKQELKIYMESAQSRYLDYIEIPHHLDIDYVLQNIVEVELNLASTASIYSFTRKCQGMSQGGIDILINNAAVHVPPDEMVVTDEGREVHFAVNYFGHFLLTHLLLGELAKRRGARIINLTCKQEAQQGSLKLEQFIGPYLEEEGLPYLPAVDGYANSKLAMYLFNRQLSKELMASNVNNVTTYAVCPGTTRTFLYRHLRFPYAQRLLHGIAAPFHKKVWHAVQPVLYCALSPKCAKESGFFYENNRRSLFHPSHVKNQDKAAQTLWDLSKQLMAVGHQAMLKLTEQMHILSHENIFQLSDRLFLHRRQVMTYLLQMEETQAFKTRHRKYVDEHGDARNDFNYYWHGFYLCGGDNSGVIERWYLYNTHPGFRELQKEYDIWFETTGSSHYHPKSNGKMAALQYMASMPAPLTQSDIEELEDLHQSDPEPDDEVECEIGGYIPMEEFID